MTMAPVRPIFQNGQRLTAERLTQALEFLRTMIRRTLLAPLSAGVAEGFTFTPIYGETSDTLTISAGLAIDGRGRLLVVPTPNQFTLTQILNAAGAANASPSEERNLIVRVSLALDDASAALDPCSPQRPLAIEEDTRFVFQVEPFAEIAAQVIQQFRNPNCVASWDALDQAFSNTDCGVTLGHAIITGYSPTTGGGTLEATTWFRQGVCPRFNVIRNTDGSPSIYFNQIQFSGGGLEAFSVDEPGIGIPVLTLIGPKPLVVTGRAVFAAAGGAVLQATHVAPQGAPFAAGQYSGGPLKQIGSGPDTRVFEFAGGAGIVGGTNQIPAELAGVAAIPCELSASSADVPRAGVPLELDATVDVGSGAVRVMIGGGGPGVIGLSAGPSYVPAIHNTTRVVPVATAGLVQAQVDYSAEVGAGTPLTSNSYQHLTEGNPSQVIVARLAQHIPAPSSAATTEALVWVVSPAMAYASS